jgi:protein SCO1/2
MPAFSPGQFLPAVCPDEISENCMLHSPKYRADSPLQNGINFGKTTFALLSALLFLLAAGLFSGAGAHEPGALPAGQKGSSSGSPASTPHGAHGTAGPAAAQPGIDEKLGSKIPLDLTFQDENGRRVTLREMITGPTIIAPVYYHCPDACDFLQGGLAQVLPQVTLKPGKDFKVLSVSFDEKETPAMARKSKAIYMDAMKGKFPPEAWHFLTGNFKNIHRLTDAAGYHFQRRGEDFLHPVGIFIVSREGKIARYLYGTSFLPMDLSLALMEGSSGRIGPTIRKVVRFCFSFDPQNKRYVFNIFRVSATVILATMGGFLAFLIFGGKKNKKKSR